MPYLWVPSIDGKVNYGPPPPGGSSTNVSVDAHTLLDNLAFAFMINAEARKAPAAAATPAVSAGQAATVQKLKELKALQTQGLITEAQYQAESQKLLNELVR